MFEDHVNIRYVVLACGAVGIRKEIDDLTMIIGENIRKRYPFSFLR